MLKFGFEPLGRELGALCLGTMNFGDTMDEDTSFAVMDAFYEMGGNFIDTARVYGAFGPNGLGTSEKVIGRWIKSRGVRNEIVLATKGAHPPIDDMHMGRLDRKSILEDLDASLKALSTDYVDVYWLHRDDVSLDVAEILETLNECVAQGKILAFGCSNWSVERISQAQNKAREMGTMGFCANQPMWSLAKNLLIEDDTLVQMDENMHSWHTESHMTCVPYTSQAKGFFSKLEAGGERALSEKAKKRYLNSRNLKIYDYIKEITAKERLKASDVALMFLTGQRAFNVHPIVGVSSVNQLMQLESAGKELLADEYVANLLRISGIIGGD